MTGGGEINLISKEGVLSGVVFYRHHHGYRGQLDRVLAVKEKNY